MRPTQKRVAQIKARKDRPDLSLSKLSDADLFAVGFEDGYSVDVRTRDPYLPRREPSYVSGHAAGRRQKAGDIAVALTDPFSDESRLRAAEARAGANEIRGRLVERWRSAAWYDSQINEWWTQPVPFDWVRLLKYVAPLRESSTQTPIFDAIRNRLTGFWTPYLRAWRVGDGFDGPGVEILPVDAPTWPILRAAFAS
jgi:hypothetical protein